MSNKKSVFVSYARADKEIVEPFVKRINEELGIRCWIDKHDIESGSEFEKRIKNAIDEAKVVLFFHSEKSLLSEWTYREMMYANNQEDIFIVPIIIDGDRMRGWFNVEFGSKDAINIKNHENVEKLLTDLRRWIGKPKTCVWAGKTISVKLQNSKKICEDKLMDTLAECVKEVGYQTVMDLHLTPNKFELVHLIDNPNLSLLPVKIGRKTIYIQNLQAKKITEMLVQISERLGLGWTIYSHCAEDKEPVEDILRELKATKAKEREPYEIRAFRTFASMYIDRDEPNYELGIESLMALAEQNDADAWNQLGLVYDDSKYEGRDIRLAMLCYQYAMELGSAYGAINLAYIYNSGTDVERNFDKVVTYLRKAEELGNCKNENLGMAYFDIATIGDDKENGFVLDCICKSARLGNRKAQEYLEAYSDFCKGAHTKNFILKIENIVETEEGNPVVCGEIQQGYITPSGNVNICHAGNEDLRTIKSIWINGKQHDFAMPGFYVGLELDKAKDSNYAIDDLVTWKKFQ